MTSRGNLKKRRNFDRPFDEFRSAYISDAQKQDILDLGDSLPDAIFQNSRYEVWIYDVHNPNVPKEQQVTHLSIKRRDKQPVRNWRDMQRIKNVLVGSEREACELYPAESRLVDTANQYHLFVLPPGMRFPFGYRDRLVVATSGGGATQEPFEDGAKPADAVERLPDGLDTVVGERGCHLLQL